MARAGCSVSGNVTPYCGRNLCAPSSGRGGAGGVLDGWPGVAPSLSFFGSLRKAMICSWPRTSTIRSVSTLFRRYPLTTSPCFTTDCLFPLPGVLCGDLRSSRYARRIPSASRVPYSTNSALGFSFSSLVSGGILLSGWKTFCSATTM